MTRLRFCAALASMLSLALAGCPRPAEQPPSEAAPAPSEPPSAPLAAPAQPGRTWTYHLRETVTGTLNKQPFHGQVVDVDYTIQTATAAAGSILDLTVSRVRIDARRADYRVEIDSDRPEQRRRVENGAEADVVFEAVLPFALLDHRLRLWLGANGDVVRLQGGAEARKRLLALFPPAQRAEPRTAARIRVALSDARIVALLAPAAGVIPASGEIYDGRRIDVDGHDDRQDHVVATAQATMYSVPEPGRTLIRSKRIDKPTSRASTVPVARSGPRRTLRTGLRDLRVELAQGDPAFVEAGESARQELEWTGVVDGETGTYLLFEERTRVWKRAQ